AGVLEHLGEACIGVHDAAGAVEHRRAAAQGLEQAGERGLGVVAGHGDIVAARARNPESDLEWSAAAVATWFGCHWQLACQCPALPNTEGTGSKLPVAPD